MSPTQLNDIDAKRLLSLRTGTLMMERYHFL